MKTEVKNNTTYLRQWEEAYRDYYKKVLNFVLGRVNNIYLAEDLTQETFLRVYDFGYAPNAKKGKFFTLLCTIARSRIYTYYRKRKEMQILDYIDKPDNNLDPEEQIIDRERKDVLYKVILNLPEKYKHPCILFAIGGYSYEEIAKMHGISIGALKSRLHRARKKIREEMADFNN